MQTQKWLQWNGNQVSLIRGGQTAVGENKAGKERERERLHWIKGTQKDLFINQRPLIKMVSLTFCCCHISAKSQASDHCMAPVYKTDVNMLTFTLALPCSCDPTMQLQCAARFIEAFYRQSFTRTIFNLNPLSAPTYFTLQLWILSFKLCVVFGSSSFQSCPSVSVTYNTGNKQLLQGYCSAADSLVF